MNKYHVVRQITRFGEILTELGFGKCSFSRATALELANGMNVANKNDSFWGIHFVVPAPFAGEI